MNGWEFAKYFVDLAYTKWYITSFFLFFIFSFSPVKIRKYYNKEKKKGHKKNEGHDS